MAKYSQTRFQELMAEEVWQEPKIPEARRLILIWMGIWIASRALLQVMEIVGAVQGLWEFSLTNISGLFIMLIFAWGLYKGEKPCAILPIIGGVVMLLQWVIYQYWAILISNEYYMIVRIYSALFLVASLIQTFAFLYLARNEKTNLLFAAFKRSLKTAREEWQLEHPKK